MTDITPRHQPTATTPYSTHSKTVPPLSETAKGGTSEDAGLVGQIFVDRLSLWDCARTRSMTDRYSSPSRSVDSVAGARRMWKKVAKEAADLASRKQCRRLATDWLNDHGNIEALDNTMNSVFPLGYYKLVQVNEVELQVLRQLRRGAAWGKLDRGLDDRLVNQIKQEIRDHLLPLSYLSRDDLRQLRDIVEELTDDTLDGAMYWKQLYLSTIDMLVNQNKPWISRSKLIGFLSGLQHKEENLPQPVKAWLHNYPYRILIDELREYGLFFALWDRLDDNPELDSERFSDLGMTLQEPHKDECSAMEESPSNDSAPDLSTSDTTVAVTVPPAQAPLPSTTTLSLAPRVYDLLSMQALTAAADKLHKAHNSYTGLDRDIGFFKAGSEAFLERQPAYVAQILGLEDVVVGGEIACLSEVTGSACGGRHILSHPLGHLQRFVNGHTPHAIKLKRRDNPDYWGDVMRRIDHQNYQEAALFGAITKQADLHGGNTFVDFSDGRRLSYKLFDIGRCLTADGYAKRSIGVMLLLRSFFMSMPQFDQPLTAETVALINGWDIDTIGHAFHVTADAPKKIAAYKQEIVDLLKILNTESDSRVATIRRIRAKEQQLDTAQQRNITPDSFVPLIHRLDALKKFVNHREEQGLPPPSMRACYEKMLPLEMSFFPLYEQVYGLDAGMMIGYFSVKQAIERGERKGLFRTEDEALAWRAKLEQLLADPDIPEIDWPWQ